MLRLLDFKCIAALTVIVIILQQAKAAYRDSKGFDFTHSYIMMSSKLDKKTHRLSENSRITQNANYNQSRSVFRSSFFIRHSLFDL